MLSEPLDSVGVSLPTNATNLGALLVMAAGALAWLGFLGFASDLERRLASQPPAPMPAPPPGPVTRPLPGSERPAKPDEEFWSPEAVVGWRVWDWVGGVLKGFWVEWTSSHLEAVCHECDEPPGWSHSCGIYAVKDIHDLPVFVATAAVIGRVEMWGVVIEHDLGYRASHARITDLWVDSPYLANAIASRYPDVNVWFGDPDNHQGNEIWPR